MYVIKIIYLIFVDIGRSELVYIYGTINSGILVHGYNRFNIGNVQFCEAHPFSTSKKYLAIKCCVHVRQAVEVCGTCVQREICEEVLPVETI